MKRFFSMMPFILIVAFTPDFAAAQNADELISNSYFPQYNYVGGSFVIDTGVSKAKGQKRAFLIWADDLRRDSINRYLGLSEYDPNLNFLTQQGNTSERSGSLLNMFPKKIIKSKFAHVYYVLGYVRNSNHKINNLNVYSSPTLYKIDGNTLVPIWARKINLAVNTTNTKTVIEYNDIIETGDNGIVLVGKYADNPLAKESVLATKVNSSGSLLWSYVYKTVYPCNEAANSVAETTDGRLSLTGYVTKCTGGSYTGKTDVFYLETQSSGIPVAGVYRRFAWSSDLNMWADKITCYTSESGKDRLIISGYVDTVDAKGALNTQILVMNLQQNGTLVTANHIGDPKADVCNDLIFSKAGTRNDYLIYLTGQTYNYNSQSSVASEAYFMYAKFNLFTGVGALQEFSIFPVTKSPFNSYRRRTGLEIKNAGDYNKFAILATGTYKPTSTTNQTYTNVLLRDLGDKAKCIRKYQPPIGLLYPLKKSSTVTFDTPAIKFYTEHWTVLDTLAVTELCQGISIDPTHAQNLKQGDDNSSPSLQALRVSPNPAQSAINITTTDGSLLSGKYKNALLRIYNTAMQAEKIVTITQVQGTSMQLPVAQLKAGVYMVQLIRGNETLRCAFIKE